MKKLFLSFILAAMLVPLHCSAQQALSRWTLVTDGGYSINAALVDYLIANEGEKTFSLVLRGTGHVVSGVQSITFYDPLANGLNNITSAKGELTVDGDKVSFLGLTEPMEVSIVDLSGRTLLSSTVSNVSPVLDLSNLTKGVYIIKTKNSSVKFLKK